MMPPRPGSSCPISHRPEELMLVFPRRREQAARVEQKRKESVATYLLCEEATRR